MNKLSFRHEKKYLIDTSEATLLKVHLKQLMLHDSHVGKNGVYKIRSVYFDDYWDSAYEEKTMGVMARCKYRIRVYNDSDEMIKLERKIKRDAYISKQSAILSRNEAEALMNGKYDFLMDNPQQLCQEFYFECVTKMMRPRVIVDYEREPFVYRTGDVRISFDMDIRGAMLRFDLFDSELPTMSVLEQTQMILEVKFTELLPSFIQEVLPKRLGQHISLSKYTMVCDKMMFLSANQGY